MPIFVRLTLVMTRRLRDWRLPFFMLFVVFWVSWPLMWLVERGNNMLYWQNYYWYFFSTLTTVGYGDMYPKTPLGHLIGVFLEIFPIALGAVLLTQLGLLMTSIRGRHMNGTTQLSLKNHVVLLGYHPDRTQEMIALLEANKLRPVVIVSPESETPQHPLPNVDHVYFVRGTLDSDEIQTLACLESAAFCLIDTLNDNLALVVALSIRKQSPTVHVVAAMENPRRTRHIFGDLPGSPVELVPLSAIEVIVQTGLCRGRGNYDEDLNKPNGEIDMATFEAPDNFPQQTVGELITRLGPSHGYSHMYVITPDGNQINGVLWDFTVTPGSLVGYSYRLPISDDAFMAVKVPSFA